MTRRMNVVRKRILIFTQHLAGVGHFFRSRLIARALAQDNDVSLIHGGRRIPGILPPDEIRTYFLEPVYYRLLAEKDPYGSTEDSLENYVPENSERNITEVFEERRKQILEIVDEVKPDFFLIEHFPFSRWAQAIELFPAIERVRKQKGRIICSVRDIVRDLDSSGISDDDKKKWMEQFRQKDQTLFDILNEHFDYLLIHSDPEVTRMEEHLVEKSVHGIHIPIYYTGYIAETLNGRSSGVTEIEDIRNDGFVLVSAGGSLEGFDVFAPCVRAWMLLTDQSRVGKRRMVLCCGPYLPADDHEELMQMCENGPFRILPFTSSFLPLMKAADFSVSRAGYNTCMNILESGTPSLVIPSRAMSDQVYRAVRLKSLGLVDVIHENKIAPQAIADAVEYGLTLRRTIHCVSLNGAQNTRELLAKL